jgi:hypothetical protein
MAVAQIARVGNFDLIVALLSQPAHAGPIGPIFQIFQLTPLRLLAFRPLKNRIFIPLPSG